MNKKISSLAGIAIIVVIAAVAGLVIAYQNWTPKPVAENSPTPTPAQSVTPTPSQSGTPVSTITPNPSATVFSIYNAKCEAIKDLKQKEYCYADLAGDRQEIEICKVLKIEEVKNYCFGGIYSFESCNLVNSADNFGKSACYEGIILSKFAKNSLTMSDCQRITIIAEKDSCFNALAVQNKQINLCDNIKNISEKNTVVKCRVNVAATLKDVSICENANLIPTVIEKDLCYNTVGGATKDLGICAKIQIKEVRETCEWGINSGL